MKDINDNSQVVKKIKSFIDYDQLRRFYEGIMPVYKEKEEEFFQSAVNEVTDFETAIEIERTIRMRQVKVVGLGIEYKRKKRKINTKLVKEIRIKIKFLLSEDIKNSTNINHLLYIKEHYLDYVHICLKDKSIKETFINQIKSVFLIEIPKTQTVFDLTKIIVETGPVFANIENDVDIHKSINNQIKIILPIEITTSEKFLYIKEREVFLFDWIEKFGDTKTKEMIKEMEEKFLKED